MNAAILSAAWRTSQRNARGSRGIHRGAIAGNLRTDVRIHHRFRHHEINGAPQHRFEPALEAEVRIESGPLPFVQKLHEEVQVAASLLEFTTGGGSKKVEPAYAEAPTHIADANSLVC